MSSRITIVTIVLLSLIALAAAEDHHYKDRDKVPMFVNKVGPRSNPSEAYEYYTLPFCPPSHIQHKHETLGEVLSADRQQSSAYDIRFNVPVIWAQICDIHLNEDEIGSFIDAIHRDFYFEMMYDDLPVRGLIGFKLSNVKSVVNADDQSNDDISNFKHFLFTHIHFDVSRNGDQVIFINGTSSRRQAVELTPGMKDLTIEFSYSVDWDTTKVNFDDRMKKYYEKPFFAGELSVHWLSIVNSLVLVALLTCVLALILIRVLKKDYARYSQLEDDEEDGIDQEETGWKLVHGDVFRIPPFFSIFSAILGTGAQLGVIVFALIFLAAVGTFYNASRGSMYTALILLYAFTSGVSGYLSSSMYKKLGGEHWALNIIITASCFAVPVMLVVGVLNSIAIYYHSSTALPFGTIIAVIVIMLFLGVPLTVIGGVTGRKYAGLYQAPTRTKNIPRQIPELPWYRSPFLQTPLVGFLPFSAICIELYYVFESVWGNKPYVLYGILLIVFGILLVVTAVVSVTLTYFQLVAEDYRWWWSSLLGGASTGFFIFAYSVYFYVDASEMSGLMQTAFYFGYTALICYAFSLILGSFAFYSSHIFVKRIYGAIKTE